MDRIIHLIDTALNDTDKSFTVALNESYEVVSAAARITTSVAVGNRVPRIEMLDEAGNLIFGVTGSTTVAASQTDAAFGEATIAAASDMTIVPVFVPPGGSIRWLDNAAIDAAVDDMEVRIMCLRRGV